MGIFPCKKQKQIIHDYPVSAFLLMNDDRISMSGISFRHPDEASGFLLLLSENTGNFYTHLNSNNHV
jgi:hypothetical protein